MEVFKVVLIIYLILGFIYAVFVSTKNVDEWRWFPVNWILGPLTTVYLVYIIARGKKFPNDW